MSRAKRETHIASVVGVDAGATKTTAALAHGETIVHRAHGAGANPTLIGVDAAAEVILRTIREACGDERSETVAAIQVGVAGAGSPEVAGDLEAILRAAYPSSNIRVSDDVEIALRAAIPNGPGIVIVAGTGSIALASDGAGNLHRAGGLGYLLGDEGSAGWIGFEGVRLLGRVYDARAVEEETSRLVARHLSVTDRPSLIRAIYAESLDVAKIAALAPSIIAFASKGNRASKAIVERAASDLAQLTVDVASAAHLAEAKPHVALSGGLLREETLLTALLKAKIASAIPDAVIIAGRDPVEGAVRLAVVTAGP
ncbi:MAG TPA: BadF/BadG/BcrA/BcrD ATPase family protein [Candidatus Acidoferrales bacterium]|nr:BadF/BadG/BcrA/BcrD ATPase family protein [Candidatus Acidoferrales bacterium]